MRSNPPSEGRGLAERARGGMIAPGPQRHRLRPALGLDSHCVLENGVRILAGGDDIGSRLFFSGYMSEREVRESVGVCVCG